RRNSIREKALPFAASYSSGRGSQVRSGTRDRSYIARVQPFERPIVPLSAAKGLPFKRVERPSLEGQGFPWFHQSPVSALRTRYRTGTTGSLQSAWRICARCCSVSPCFSG